MNETKRTDSRIDDMDFSALDRELEQMAAETPEVPADFHASWTQKIREEAQAGVKPEADAPAAKTRTDAFRRQRKYIVSAAAALVLLVGGVALTQNRPGNRTLQTPVQTSQPVTAGETEKNGYEAEETDPEEETAAEEAPQTETAGETSADTDGAVMMAMEVAMEESGDWETAYETDGEEPEDIIESAMVPASEPSNAKAAAAGSAGESSGHADAEEAEEPEAGMTSTAAGFAAESRKTANAAPMPESTSEPTPQSASAPVPAPEPVQEPEKTAEEASAEAAEELPAENGGEETAAEPQSFLQSVWSFLLDAAPWVLGGVIVILFLATYVFHIGRKK